MARIPSVTAFAHEPLAFAPHALRDLRRPSPAGHDSTRSRIPSRWTLRPTGKLTTRSPSATITMLASKSNGHELLENARHGEQRQRPFQIGLRASAPAVRGRRTRSVPGLQHGGQPDLRPRRPAATASSSTAAKSRRRQPVRPGRWSSRAGGPASRTGVCSPAGCCTSRTAESESPPGHSRTRRSPHRCGGTAPRRAAASSNRPTMCSSHTRARRSVRRRIEAHRANPHRTRRLGDHQPQLAASYYSYRFSLVHALLRLSAGRSADRGPPQILPIFRLSARRPV